MKKVVVIKTQHLLIHPMTQQHLKFLLKLWNDPEIMQYLALQKTGITPKSANGLKNIKKI